jgi:hypothetical protein
MKARPPEVDEVAPDVVRDRIRAMEVATRRRAVMTCDPSAREAARHLTALVEAGSTDLAEALRLWNGLEWWTEAP